MGGRVGPQQPFMRAKVIGSEEERSKRKHTVNSGHYVLPAMPKGSTTLCLDQKITKMNETGVVGGVASSITTR